MEIMFFLAIFQKIPIFRNFRISAKNWQLIPQEIIGFSSFLDFPIYLGFFSRIPVEKCRKSRQFTWIFEKSKKSLEIPGNPSKNDCQGNSQ
jgi:hypothetical protein